MPALILDVPIEVSRLALEESRFREEVLRVFGDSASAEEWLAEPIPSLGGRRPGDLIRGSESDRQRVSTILGRVKYGIF